jgi:hypothetical protein
MGNSFCCERADGGPICDTSGAACGGGGGTVRVYCDEPADCPMTRDCCLAFAAVGGGSGIAMCQGGTKPCNAADLTLCKTNAQCGDAGTCKQVTCTGGYKFYACNTTADCK